MYINHPWLLTCQAKQIHFVLAGSLKSGNVRIINRDHWLIKQSKHMLSYQRLFIYFHVHSTCLIVCITQSKFLQIFHFMVLKNRLIHWSKKKMTQTSWWRNIKIIVWLAHWKCLYCSFHSVYCVITVDWLGLWGASEVRLLRAKFQVPIRVPIPSLYTTSF